MILPPLRTNQSTRGALMAAALLLMLVSGLFLSAWVSLMSTRAAQVSYMEEAVQRRISVENSRQLAWQCAVDKAFEVGGTLAPNQDGVLGANVGGINTHTGWTNLNVYTSTAIPGVMDKVFPYNYTGMRPMLSYLNTGHVKRPSSLTEVDDFNDYLFLKTYSPLLAGDLFICYRKPEHAPTELDIYANTTSHHAMWTVEGRTVIRSPESLFAKSTASPLQLPFRTRSLYIQSHDTYNSRAVLGTDISGNKLLPSNLPALPSTTGPVSTTAAERYEGYLNVIRNDLNPDNSLWHFMEREQTAGRSDYATIDVFTKSATATGPYWMEEQENPTYPPPKWPSGYPPRLRVLIIQLNDATLPHLRIHGVVDQIIFKGQTTAAEFENAGLMSPVMFAITPMNSKGPSVRDIRFEKENNRRIVMGAQHWNHGDLDISWVGDPIGGAQYNWRTVFINEYQTVMLNMPSNVTQTVRWIGGVMTNWTFKRRVAGGSNASRLTLAADASLTTGTPSTPAFATLLPRDGWLESFFLPVPPPES
jgi:hypothetical protein